VVWLRGAGWESERREGWPRCLFLYLNDEAASRTAAVAEDYYAYLGYLRRHLGFSVGSGDRWLGRGCVKVGVEWAGLIICPRIRGSHGSCCFGSRSFKFLGVISVFGDMQG
jgi:hypothetical protein